MKPVRLECVRPDLPMKFCELYEIDKKLHRNYGIVDPGGNEMFMNTKQPVKETLEQYIAQLEAMGYKKI